MNFDIVNILYLPVVIYIGVVSSIDDWRTQKIKNKVLARGMISGAIIFVFLMIWSYLIQPDSFLHSKIKLLFSEETIFLQTVNISFFLKTVFNFIFASIVGFLMWKSKLMAAGDAKLFAVFVWLLPVTFYWRTYLSIFPAFSLLVNIFFVIFIFFLVKSIFFLIKNLNLVFNKKNFIKIRKININNSIDFFNKKTIPLFWVYFLIVAILLLMKNITVYSDLFDGEKLGLFQGYLMVLFIIFRKQIIDFIKRKKVKFLFVIFLAINMILAFLSSPSELFIFMRTVALIMIIFVILIDLILGLINLDLNHSAVKKMRAKDLMPGNIISERVVEKLKKDKIIFHKYVGRILPRGLDENEVITIKEWAKKRDLNQIEVYEHFSFAFWIFLGVITTIFFQGSVINIILNGIKP